MAVLEAIEATAGYEGSAAGIHLTADAGVLQVRRIVARMLATETGRTAAEAGRRDMRSADIRLAAGSAHLPHGFALLSEGSHALHDVLGGRRQRELCAQRLQRVGQAHVPRGVDGILAQAHEER